MPIEKISLQNFRSHKQISIHLDPRITVLTGSNGSGKSNLLRAIRWIACNRPMGNSVKRRQSSKQTKVTIQIDGKRISRTKSDSRNDYTLDGQKLSAPKSSVPQPIQQILSMSESNFAMHWRGPAFWFGLTAGEVAKELNRIVNLDLIDRSLGRIASKVRALEAEKKVTKSRLREAERYLSELSGIPSLLTDFKSLKNLYDSTQQLREKLRRGGDLLSDRQTVASGADRALETVYRMRRLVHAAGQVTKTASRLQNLREQLFKIKEIRQDIVELEQKKGAANLHLQRAISGRCPLCKQPWKGED